MSHDPANAGALAFKRSGDPNMGNFGDATVLKTFGEVPETLDVFCPLRQTVSPQPNLIAGKAVPDFATTLRRCSLCAELTARQSAAPRRPPQMLGYGLRPNP